MREETTYQWRVQWTGKWTTTKYHCTEDHIRKEHPDAVCLVETKRVQWLPETAEEFADVARANSTGNFQRGYPGPSPLAPTRLDQPQ